MQLKQIQNKLQTYSKSLYFDPATPKETFFLASSGRSGSTWIQEVLSNTGSYRILFEPFFPHEIDIVKDWEVRQYIGRNDSGAEFMDAVRSIIHGRVRHPWIDQDNTTLFPKRRFIKEIRGNLFIAWLKTHFPWIRLIFLTRHPFAVSKSRMKLGWGPNLDVFFRQNDLIRRHFPNDIDFINSISSEFGKQVAFWSIENLVPLRELSEGDAFAIAYEDIKDDPRSELDRISSALGIPTQAISLDSLTKPSRTSALTKSKTAAISDADIEEAWRVLTHFGLDALYEKDEGSRPQFATRTIFSEFEWGE